MELRNTSKQVLLNYINESPQPKLILRAREAIRRYIQEELPSLEEIRAKAQAGEDLNEYDHKLLKMEYEARRFEERYHRRSK